MRCLRCRGVALGITSQLSSSIPSINMSGFTMGDGDNALLLGTNVIGAIVAWGLMAITLLENPFGAPLAQVSLPGVTSSNLSLSWQPAAYLGRQQPILAIHSIKPLAKVGLLGTFLGAQMLGSV